MFSPVPKFLCVKGILFFSFWQSIAISTLVAVGAITKLGPYTDSEHISLGLTDTLICVEMPFFAVAHMYAFSYRDFVKSSPSAKVYVARMRMGYALRDAFGLKDLAEDTKTTLRGEGINYRAFEPSEGGMHVGAARERRIRAGLRYSAGGRRKYWLPEVRGLGDRNTEGDHWFGRAGNDRNVTAPLLEDDVDDVVHTAPDMRYQEQWRTIGTSGEDADVEDDDEYALRFNDALAAVDDTLYEHARKYVFGDYAYPVVDVSSEEARRAMWAEEARIVREGVHIDAPGIRRSVRSTGGYGATSTRVGPMQKYEDGEDEGFASDERAADSEEDGRSRAKYKNVSPPISSSNSSESGSGSGKPLHPSGRSSRHESYIPHAPHPKLSYGSNINVRASSPYLHSSPSHSRSNVGTPPSRLLSPGSYVPHPRSPHSPLAEPDAVDLVVATDTLQVPSKSHSPHASPRATGLKRIWGQERNVHNSSSGGIEGNIRWSNEGRTLFNAADDDNQEAHNIRKEEPKVPEVHEPVEVVRTETPPSHARAWKYDETRSPEEDEENPWM